MSFILNSYESQPFKMTIAVVTPVTFVLPIASGGSVYNGTIFWGDGTTSTVTAAGNYSKAYASAGNYTIRIIGLFHGIYFNNTGTSKDLVTSISGMGRLKTLANSFRGCRLTSVSGTIRPDIIDINYAWGVNQLTSWTVPIPNSVVNMSHAWRENQLTSWTVPIPNSVIDIFAAWYFNQLTSWTVPIPSSVTQMSYAWTNNQLTAWTTPIPGSVTNIEGAWQNNLLTEWTIAIPNSVVNISWAWYNNRLTSWTVPIPSSVTNISYAWRDNQLTSWTVPIPNSVTNIDVAWYDNQLTSWTVPIPSSVTQMSYAWAGNQLTSWDTPIPSSVINASNAWDTNPTLTTFATNIFDGCNCTNFANAFTSTALTQASIDNILVSINSNNTSNGTFNQSGGSAPSATGQAAITAMRSRGWTITVTGGF